MLTESVNTFFTQQRISQLIMSAVVIVLAIVIWLVFSRTLRRLQKGRKGIVPADGRIGTITSVTMNIMRGIIILIVILIVLEINGIKITSLVAGLGIASAIVGLALQDYLKDVIMGTHIMSDSFFQVGDVVRYGTVEGTVTDFNLRTTKLQSIADGSVLTVSNRNISEITKLGNQIFFDIPLSYDAAPADANAALNRLCREAEKQIEGVIKCANLGIADLQDSSVIYKIQLVCPPERKLELRRKVLSHLFCGVQETGLQVPYSQLDVHVRN